MCLVRREQIVRVMRVARQSLPSQEQTEAKLILAKPRSVQEHCRSAANKEGNIGVSVFCHPCVTTLACEELDFSSSRTTVI